MDLTPHSRAALTTVTGATLVIVGATCMFGPAALAAAGVVVLVVGLFVLDDGGSA